MLTTADEPSLERMTEASAAPSAANASAPRASVAASASGRDGSDAPNATRPSAITETAWTPNTASVEPRTDAR